MSSGGWEIVGKKSKDKTNGKTTKLTKAEKKNFIINSPKLEDFLPLNEVKSLYDSLDVNKENKKPSKEKDSKSKENEEKKRQQKLKQQQADKNKKQQQQQQQQKSKEKLPRSAEKGVAGLNADELNELLENDKIKFPDAPLIWLKDLVSYLDAKITIDREDTDLRTKPDNYPLCILTKAVRASLEKTIKLAGSQNAQLCWEGTLSTMVKNISNNSSDIGCKIFLQLLAQTNPDMTAANLPKLASLRNSYQNKKPIGSALLWAFAQSGKKNLSVGLTIWHEIMAPMLESKSWASYVIKILNDTLVATKSFNNMRAQAYLDIVDDFYSGRINISASAENEIAECMKNLRLKMIESELIDRGEIFEILITRITTKTSSAHNDEIVGALADCLASDSRCLSVWTSLYRKNLYQSDLLLKKLFADWNKLRCGVDAKALGETLLMFRNCGVASKKGRDESLAQSCEKTSESLLKKMSASKKKEESTSFPFKTGIIVLLFMIGAIVTYDVQFHGSYEASTFGVLLKRSGVTHYGNNALSAVNHYKNNALNYLETTYPEYYRATVDVGAKYVRLCGELYLITRNIAVRAYLAVAKYTAERKHLVTDNIEYYFPGLLEHIHKRSLVEIERFKTYSSIVREHFTVQSVKFVRWLETNVFVDSLSPKNIRGYATRAIETSQKMASQTYDWVYEKYQTLSKIH